MSLCQLQKATQDGVVSTEAMKEVNTMANRNARTEITWEILEHLVSFGTRKDTGWSKEANIVAWNGGVPKLDIREWSPDHSKMGKGCTLTADELAALKDIINEIDLDSFE
jgi:hypothetical protein